MTNQQAFVSTHSEDIIRGLLEVCPERIKVIRITREDDTNSFSVLDNNQFGEAWNDPLLKYSNIMSSLFHKSVVLCENDSDCKIYSIVESHLKQEAGKFSETLFIHCGGKHRMAKISRTLRSLNVDVKLIPDIDVMNDENAFKGIVDAFGISWASVEKDYRVIVSNLHSPKENVKRNDAKATINSILDKTQTPFISSTEQKGIRDAAGKTLDADLPLADRLLVSRPLAGGDALQRVLAGTHRRGHVIGARTIIGGQRIRQHNSIHPFFSIFLSWLLPA